MATPTDTDRLASYLEAYRGRYFERAGVYLGPRGPRGQGPRGQDLRGLYHPEYSKIAKFVRSIHPEWFHAYRPNTQVIDFDIIRKIRGLHREFLLIIYN